MQEHNYQSAITDSDIAEQVGQHQRHRHSAFSILLDCELVVVVALVLAFIVPQLFGIVPDVVMSSSMAPDIPAGSVAYIDENVGAQDLNQGEVAVYRPTEGKQVMHRIIECDGQTFTFKGDANQDVDANPVDATQIVGRYLFHVPIVGWGYVFFDEHRVAVIVGVVLLNLLVYVLSERSRRREEREAAEQAEHIQEMIARTTAAQTAQVLAAQGVRMPNQTYRPPQAQNAPLPMIPLQQKTSQMPRVQMGNTYDIDPYGQEIHQL